MVLEVRDIAAVSAFYEKLFPHGNVAPSSEDGTSPAPRGEAVALFRDAKRARSAAAEPVLLRAAGEARAVRGEASIDLCELTRAAGAACLLVDDRPGWCLQGTVAVIENLEVFLSFEKLRTRASTALYSAGRLSRRVRSWLASDEMRSCDYLHCGDYDPVGLDEYLRLRDELGSRVELHLPPCIEALFRRYGKRELLRDSPAILARLRRVDLPSIRRVVSLMDETGCGLEQEALLLDRP
ncbi:MAG: DUF2220 family protein [Polyangia bacterium]